MTPSDAQSHGTLVDGRARTFLLLHAAATLLDASEKWSEPAVAIIALGFSLALLLAPRRRLLGVLYLASSAALLIGRVPELANHHNATLVLDLLLLGGVAHVTLGRRGAPAVDDDAFDCVAPALRACVAVIYIAAGVHKLNADFIHVDVSCAGRMVEKATWVWGGVQGGLDLPAWLVLTLAVGTWVWELIGGAALLSRRARPWGIAAMFALHTLLALVVFFDFAAIMLATYVAFTPRDATPGRAARLHRAARIHLTLSIASALLSGLVIVGLSLELRLAFLTQGLLYVFSSALVMRALWPLLTAEGPLESRPAPRWPAAVVAALILFASSNYLGLRTAGTFSMFSNLRTEGGQNNHLLLPTLELADYQRDLIWFERIDPGEGREHNEWLQNRALPRVELDKLVLRWRDEGQHDVGATLRDGERVLETRDLARDWSVRSSALERAALDFRTVQPHPPNLCRW